jgi:hypothetical protein
MTRGGVIFLGLEEDKAQDADLIFLRKVLKDK